MHGSPLEVFQIFLKLGLTAFGGPMAHLGYFEREIIERRKWLSQNAYGDLVALCQFLPGPASSQVAFALGYLRAGIGGAFAATIGFTVPSAVLMIAIAYGFRAISTQSGFLHGLKLAAVAVVAQAVWTMAVKLCPDRERVTLAIVASCVVLGSSVAWLQQCVIAAGALFGWISLRENAGSGESLPVGRRLHGGWFAWSNIALYFLLLGGLPLLSAVYQDHWLQLADAFYHSGALVFGGGHVVLPLLQSQTVSRGWLDQNTFMAGYGAAQAMPGPLFTFSAYLGTVIGHGWLAGLWCLTWIFLPSFLLLLGTLPLWSSLRRNTGAQAALRGANAVVVGILLAALYNPVWTVAVDSSVALIIAMAAFGLLQFWKWSPWLLVLLSGTAGFVFLRQ
ncbi:MAG: chromate efflux transporter [Verrucomicrobia bacterium]|nr:chromate efflux transporter [Verrucomicrobiota bacterium]